MISYFVRASIKLYFYFQTQISISSWPHDGIWPQLMEDYNVLYKSHTFTAMAYNGYILNGPECYEKGNYLQNAQALMDYQKKNFMKVRFLYSQFCNSFPSSVNIVQNAYLI